MRKVPYCDIVAKLGKLSSVSREFYGSHSYVAGYYEATLVRLIGDLPAHKQNELMRSFQTTIESLQKNA